MKIAEPICPETGMLDTVSELRAIFRNTEGIRSKCIRCASEKELIAAVDMSLGDLSLEGREVFASNDWAENDADVDCISSRPVGWDPPAPSTYYLGTSSDQRRGRNCRAFSHTYSGRSNFDIVNATS